MMTFPRVALFPRAYPGLISGSPFRALGRGAPELFLTVLPVCGRRNECSGSLLHLQRTRNGVQRRQSWQVSHRAQAEQCGCLARSAPMGDQGRASVRQTQRKRPLCDAGFGHAHAGSLGVILLWSWPWRSLAASETTKANQNAVTVRRREERSDEEFNNYSAIAADIP